MRPRRLLSSIICRPFVVRLCPWRRRCQVVMRMERLRSPCRLSHSLTVLNHLASPLKASSPFQSLFLHERINRYIANTTSPCLLSLLRVGRVINCKHHRSRVSERERKRMESDEDTFPLCGRLPTIIPTAPLENIKEEAYTRYRLPFSLLRF